MDNSEKQGSWMAVEVMGHRQHVGRVLEVSRFGATFMQIDELQRDGSFKRLTYGGSAIFSFKVVSEEESRRHVLPKSWQACGEFKPAVVLATHCEDCGKTEEAHTKAKALPARTQEDEGASGLSEPERRVLHLLQVQADEDRPGLSAEEVSRALDLSPNDTDAALSLLTARGKVVRQGDLWRVREEDEGFPMPDEPEDEATAASTLRCGTEVDESGWGCDLLRGHPPDVDHRAGGYGPPRLRHGAVGWERAWTVIAQKHGALGANGTPWGYQQSGSDGHVFEHPDLGREVIPIEPRDFYPKKCAEGVGCGLAGCPTCSHFPDPSMYERSVAAWAANDGSAP